MSNHTFKTTHNDRPVLVNAGWDRPLQGFFMTVLYTDSTEDWEFAFNNLEMEQPNPREFNVYVKALQDLGIKCPLAMFLDIISDGRANMGNKVVEWNAQGEQLL